MLTNTKKRKKNKTVFNQSNLSLKLKNITRVGIIHFITLEFISNKLLAIKAKNKKIKNKC